MEIGNKHWELVLVFYGKYSHTFKGDKKFEYYFPSLDDVKRTSLQLQFFSVLFS